MWSRAGASPPRWFVRSPHFKGLTSANWRSGVSDHLFRFCSQESRSLTAGGQCFLAARGWCALAAVVCCASDGAARPRGMSCADRPEELVVEPTLCRPNSSHPTACGVVLTVSAGHGRPRKKPLISCIPGCLAAQGWAPSHPNLADPGPAPNGRGTVDRSSQLFRAGASPGTCSTSNIFCYTLYLAVPWNPNPSKSLFLRHCARSGSERCGPGTGFICP